MPSRAPASERLPPRTPDSATDSTTPAISKAAIADRQLMGISSKKGQNLVASSEIGRTEPQRRRSSYSFPRRAGECPPPAFRGAAFPAPPSENSASGSADTSPRRQPPPWQSSVRPAARGPVARTCPRRPTPPPRRSWRCSRSDCRRRRANCNTPRQRAPAKRVARRPIAHRRQCRRRSTGTAGRCGPRGGHQGNRPGKFVGQRRLPAPQPADPAAGPRRASRAVPAVAGKHQIGRQQRRTDTAVDELLVEFPN